MAQPTPVQSEYPHPPSQSRSKKKILLITIPVVILGIILCACCAAIGAYYLMEDEINDWFQSGSEKTKFQEKDEDTANLLNAGGQPGLSLNPRGADGFVSGSYQLPDELDGKRVEFNVTDYGYATFHLADSPDSELLEVNLGEENDASLTWSGKTLDGMGELTESEAAALENLLKSDLLQAVSMIPLEMACQAEGTLDVNQLAALLVPLQMHFKYNVTGRQAEALSLIALSECNYIHSEDNQTKFSSPILFSPSNPVPVVLGYFPFDAEGAVESPAARESSSVLYCSASHPDQKIDLSSFYRPPAGVAMDETKPIVDEWGPCEAMCRGACGPDCTTNNCKKETELRCEIDEETGENTGMVYQVTRYDCGLHPACIKHDACYDKCNTDFPCDSWAAAYCRHGGYHVLANPIQAQLEYIYGYLFCDATTLSEEDGLDVIRWVDGYGPQPTRQVFEYADREYGTRHDPAKCPLPEPKKLPEDQPQVSEPDQPIRPCDFMPESIPITQNDETQCSGEYSQEPFMGVTINLLEKDTDTEKLCSGVNDDKFTLIKNELTLGDCSYENLFHHWEYVDATNYTGWGIKMILDRYWVEVYTFDIYPNNEYWIHSTTKQIEEKIGFYAEFKE